MLACQHICGSFSMVQFHHQPSYSCNIYCNTDCKSLFSAFLICGGYKRPTDKNTISVLIVVYKLCHVSSTKELLLFLIIVIWRSEICDRGHGLFCTIIYLHSCCGASALILEWICGSVCFYNCYEATTVLLLG